MRIDINIQKPAGFGQLKDKFERGVEKGIKRSTELVTQTAKQKAPVQFGTLRRSIIGRVHNSGMSTIGTIRQDEKIAPYGKFVEFGTGLYGPKHQRIIPTSSKALAWMVGRSARPSTGAGWRQAVKAGRAIVVRSIKGMRAEPYMRPALQDNIENVKQIMVEEIDKALKG